MAEESYIEKYKPKDAGRYVSKFDPRRVLPQYTYRQEVETQSDVGRAGADYYYRTNLDESEAREKVNIVSDPHPVVRNLRKKFDMYDDMDDEAFMDAVTIKYPEYNDVLSDVKKRKQRLYHKIDLIEFKKSIGVGLNADEAFINLVGIPEDKGRIGQQAVLGYGNMASFGAQNFILNKLGFDQTRPTSGAEAVAAGAGTLAGFIQSPIEVSKKILTNFPGLNAIFAPINASSRAQKLLKPLLRSGAVLGTADLLMIPEDAYKEGMVQPGERVKSFGGGFMFGAGLGSLGYIPNRVARMVSSSIFYGLPSTLQEATLEEQVFQYGFGAYSGIHGTREMIKSEDAIRKTIEKGITNKVGQEQLLKQGEGLLNELETMMRQEGEPYASVVDAGKKQYTPVWKGWKKATLKNVSTRLKEIRKDPNFPLRNDKISNLMEELKGKRIADLTDAQLYNLNEHIKPENTPLPPSRQFITRPPSRPGSVQGKHLSMWHNFFRLGYQSMEHMGFGGMFDEGLTSNVFKGDVKYNVMMLKQRQLTNTWKKLVGMNPETARMMFLARDGKLDLSTMAKNHPEYTKHLKASKQIGRYTDIMLELQNRHRAKYGLEPIKPVKGNYITHIFDQLRNATNKEKYPFPDYLADIMEFIPPKQANQPFLKARRGAKGYRENIWAALDAYGYRAADYVSDDSLRHANRITKWLTKEMNVNYKQGKQSPIDLKGIKQNVRGWADRYSGRPGKIDGFIKDSVKNLPSPLNAYLGNLERVSGIWRTLSYTGAMGWRPKLALRNLGQHSLILGEVGTKPLWKAVTTRNSAEARALLQHSDVLKTRELGFAPEVPYGLTSDTLETLRNNAFFMFRKADRINVEDAFLAGFYEVTGGKVVKSGTNLFKNAVKRGDSVAALTQYMYTKGNRGPISNLWGMSASAGKWASMFTTWPINKVELDIAWSREGHRHKMVRYLGVVGLGTLASVASGGKFRSTAYTGFGAETGVARKIQDGLLSLRSLPLIPQLLAGNDVRRALEDDELWKVILYDVRQNAPMWEKF